MTEFKGTRDLGEIVTNRSSGEQGEVLGRAEYAHSEPTYMVRFKAADGRAGQEWWEESVLVPRAAARAAGTALVG